MDTLAPKYYQIIGYVSFVGATICFSLGLYFPIMTTKVLYGLQSNASYLSSTITYFYRQGDYFLATLLLIFSLILPVLKFLLLGLALLKWQNPVHQKIMDWLHHINKWAMLDVFVVALVIVNIKTGNGLLRTQLEIGTTFFALAIILLMICTHAVSRLSLTFLDNRNEL